MAAPSNIRQISGTISGLLDPTQPERLLRLPGSKLHFAAFDPLAATAGRDGAGLPKLSIKEELCRSKRIVIETPPGGDSFWRYVPNARLEDGVEDEGEWPRAINICGEMIQCSQDQWDVYKLDPLYACFVRSHPQPTQIIRVTQAESAPQNLQRKRRASTPSPERSAPAPSRRKLHSDPDEDPDDVTDESMSNIDEMIVDPLPHSNAKLGFRKTSMDKEQRENSRQRTPSGREFSSCTAETSNDFLPADARVVRKRKLPDIPESSSIPDMSCSQDHRSNTYVRTQNGKRARTVSPSSNARLDSKRLKHEKPKRKRKEQSRRRNELFDTPVAEATCQMQENIKEKHDGPDPAGSAKDGEHLGQATIEESRRKIAELEADKPLWEAAAKQRMAREKEEPETIRVKAESSRTKKKEESEREARIVQEEEERKRKEEERLHKEEVIRSERERRRRQQQRWAFGPWTTQRALERYKILSEEFDSTKFSADLPLTMETVPWPVLTPPARFSVADVDWGAVEKFFSGVKEFMGTQDYKTFVEKSHRRFHPDRWRSRSLLKTVLDEIEKNNMEVAANTVAQALTPIWRGVTGR